MTLQARLSRPALSCIVRSMETVISRFIKTGAGIKYLTLYRQEWRTSAYRLPALYGFYFLELQSLSSVKATDTGLETLKKLRRAPASIGGLSMLVVWQSLLLPFYGVLLSGSRKAYPFPKYGVSNLIATPAPVWKPRAGTLVRT